MWLLPAIGVEDKQAIANGSMLNAENSLSSDTMITGYFGLLNAILNSVSFMS